MSSEDKYLRLLKSARRVSDAYREQKAEAPKEPCLVEVKCDSEREAVLLQDVLIRVYPGVEASLTCPAARPVGANF